MIEPHPCARCDRPIKKPGAKLCPRCAYGLAIRRNGVKTGKVNLLALWGEILE